MCGRVLLDVGACVLTSVCGCVDAGCEAIQLKDFSEHVR